MCECMHVRACVRVCACVCACMCVLQGNYVLLGASTIIESLTPKLKLLIVMSVIYQALQLHCSYTLRIVHTHVLTFCDKHTVQYSVSALLFLQLN